MAQTLIVDGVDLSTLGTFQARTGLISAPGRAGANLRVPGRDGTVWQAKDYAESHIVLDYLVTSADEADYDAVLALFGKRHGLLTVEKIVGSSHKINYGEVTTVIEPDFADPGVGVLKIEITFPNPLWVAANVTEEAHSGAGAHTFTEFTGMTAPITDATILVHGPADAGVKLTDVVSGSTVTLTEALGSGDVWRLVLRPFRTEVGASLDYSGGATSNAIVYTRYAPGPRLFTITPSPATLTPSLSLTGTGLTGTSSVSVQARRRYIA